MVMCLFFYVSSVETKSSCTRVQGAGCPAWGCPGCSTTLARAQACRRCCPRDTLFDTSKKFKHLQKYCKKECDVELREAKVRTKLVYGAFLHIYILITDHVSLYVPVSGHSEFRPVPGQLSAGLTHLLPHQADHQTLHFVELGVPIFRETMVPLSFLPVKGFSDYNFLKKGFDNPM